MIIFTPIQIKLIHSQFKKTIEKINNNYNKKLKKNLLLLLSDNENNTIFNPNILKKIQKKIPLININNITKKSITLTNITTLTNKNHLHYLN